eukprot:CAMPEP_0172184540 /NCGR_PEP_ID=MMETSP1050-20130122/19636_1 /TAXON_ID=233186 /ORGANISM="Cryptomonas curvata, Strain CCAP979/52" /LENGTH=181 /DNA_ID=CAMNT_0012858357 /DNA_START=29 /DNA_END=571 /DNA_ORIENTATION=-
MTSCKHEFLGCEPLAHNILAVAEEIERSCFALYFDSGRYYACEAKAAAPLCRDVSEEFPAMCEHVAGGYTADDGGYIGSEEPANIRGEFCRGCARLSSSGGGCFATTSLVHVADANGRPRPATLGDIRVGDRIRSVDDDGRPVWSEVYFLHDHPAPAPTVVLHFPAAAGKTGKTGRTGKTG